jgi:hypothetical protein
MGNDFWGQLMTTMANAMLGLSASVALLLAQPLAAQTTIYPLGRAEILAGSKFDLKVEFPGGTAPGDITVTVNGRDAAELLGKSPAALADEEGRAMPPIGCATSLSPSPAPTR